jgi:hypothetical protein
LAQDNSTLVPAVSCVLSKAVLGVIMMRLGEGKLEAVYGTLRWMGFLVLAACFATCLIVSAHADDDDRDRGGESRAYAIGLWGDLPYSDLQAQVGVPNLIADMNAQKMAT